MTQPWSLKGKIRSWTEPDPEIENARIIHYCYNADDIEGLRRLLIQDILDEFAPKDTNGDHDCLMHKKYIERVIPCIINKRFGTKP